MRIPKVYRSQLDSSDIQKQTITINELIPLDFYAPEWQDDEKDYIKLMKQIEKLVRNSYEYKNYIKYLKEEIDMNCCSFFNKLTREDISLEIHHSPLTLFEITTIVFQKHFNEYGNDLDIYSIAEEITRLHYEGKVGLIPLSLTVHELVHRGEIFIPINCVYGNIKEFYREYKEFFKEEQINLLKNHIATSKQINKENYRPSVLDRKFTYIEVDGISLPKMVECGLAESKIS